MTHYWVLGLIPVIVLAIWLGYRRWRSRRPPAKVDLLLWDDEPTGPREFVPGEAEDDTAPAVLAPPERERPPSAFNSFRR